ncbi:unnamed protein product [Calypogeia fissa]
MIHGQIHCGGREQRMGSTLQIGSCGRIHCMPTGFINKANPGESLRRGILSVEAAHNYALCIHQGEHLEATKSK